MPTGAALTRQPWLWLRNQQDIKKREGYIQPALHLAVKIWLRQASSLLFIFPLKSSILFSVLLLTCSNGILLTDSLWHRQSDQSFNRLTPFYFFFLFYSLHVSAPTGHPQVRYTISYISVFWRTILIQRIRCTHVIRSLHLEILFAVIGFFNL
jgi:hypothetical protein